MDKRSFGTLTMALALLALPTWAQAQLATKGKSSASFVALGPAGLKIEGTTNELKIEEAGPLTRVIVPLAMLDTGISLRNTHMREKYLETPKYPNAVLEIQSAAIKRPTAGASVSSTLPGQLTIHGVTKTVNVKYSAKLAAGAIAVDASFHIKLGDFDIHVPSYLGVTVKPDVDVMALFSVVET